MDVYCCFSVDFGVHLMQFGAFCWNVWVPRWLAGGTIFSTCWSLNGKKAGSNFPQKYRAQIIPQKYSGPHFFGGGNSGSNISHPK